MISTYQTRVTVFRSKDRVEGDAALAAYAELYWLGLQRKLFADIAAGSSAYLVEERVPEAVRDTGADVQCPSGVAGGQGGVGARDDGPQAGQSSDTDRPGRASGF